MYLHFRRDFSFLLIIILQAWLKSKKNSIRNNWLFPEDSSLTLSVPEKLKNPISEIPITREPQVQSLSTWMSLESLLNILLTLTCWWRQFLLLPFSRYCCSKVGRYFHPPSGVQGAKRLKFDWKIKKLFSFCWNYLKSDYLTRLGDIEWFLVFFLFCLTLSAQAKLKSSIFEIPTRSYGASSLCEICN